METFSASLALCAGNSPVPVNSPHKGQWRGALMFSLICARINDWVNNSEAGDLRRHRGHYDVSVMWCNYKNNFIPYLVRDEIISHFFFNGAAAEAREGISNFMSYFIRHVMTYPWLLGMWWLITDGILFHWFCKCTPPWMFLPLDIPSEYRPEHVTFGLLCVIFKFPSRIFCRRVPGFATDCPCGVWCRGLTTCLLYVGPPLEF